MTDTEYDVSKLPPATAPENISVSLQGFSLEEANRFGRVIASIVHTISRCIDLERLDGITIAFDYNNALAEIDRGYQARR